MDWISEVERWDRKMAAAGLGDSERGRRIAALADVYAQIETAMRRHTQEMEAARLLHLGATLVAERQGCHVATAYRRAKRFRTVATPCESSGG